MSDGRIAAYDMTKSDTGLCQSFDSSSIDDMVASRLRPVLCLAVTHGLVYVGDSSVNVKVINCSHGET